MREQLTRRNYCFIRLIEQRLSHRRELFGRIQLIRAIKLQNTCTRQEWAARRRPQSADYAARRAERSDNSARAPRLGLIWCNSSVRTRTPRAVCGRAGCLNKSKHENLIIRAHSGERNYMAHYQRLRLLCASVSGAPNRACCNYTAELFRCTHNAQPSAFRCKWLQSSAVIVSLGFCHCCARRRIYV